MRYAQNKVPRSPKSKSKNVSNVMKANKAKNTEPEITLRKELHKSGIKGFATHCDIPGRPDICFPKQHVAIFVHGCFWHRCPYCKLRLPKTHTAYWKLKFRLNKRRDIKKRKELEKMGWKVFEVWECQIRKNVNVFIRNVTKELKK